MSDNTGQRKTPLLFESYPLLKGSIPWTPLIHAPTPLELLGGFSKRLATEVWVKRDDLSNPLYGGNKPRKLEFLLAAAREKGKRGLVTIGGIGTNHGLATTILGKHLGFGVALLLFAQPVSEHVRHNLLLYHAHTAEMILCESMDDAELRYRETERVRRPGAYFIPAGGSSVLGSLGYVEAGLELAQQIRAGDMPLPCAIFAAAGTCGTVSGLVVGLRLGGMDTPVIGVQVTPPQVANQAGALDLANKALGLLRKHDPGVPALKIGENDLAMDTAHYGMGYGRATAEGREAMELMAATEGLDMEQTYTAKTLAALIDHARAGKGKGPLLYVSTLSSVDHSERIAQVDWHDLPPEFHRFFLD